MRSMRMMVMFDLPTKTEKNKKDYIQFRRFLLQDGFDMMQYSVYTRYCPTLDLLEKHVRRVKGYLPKQGSVRVISLTNKQYAEMAILVGEKRANERRLTHENLTLF